MSKSAYQILQKPVITERGLDAKERGTMVFRVSAEANKVEIKTAVESLFKVKVDSVRTAVFPGKMRRRGRTFGYRPDWKKAYVKLRPGEKVPEYAESA